MVRRSRHSRHSHYSNTENNSPKGGHTLKNDDSEFQTTTQKDTHAMIELSTMHQASSANYNMRGEIA